MPKLTVFLTGIVGFTPDFTRALMVNAPHASVLTVPPDSQGKERQPVPIPGHAAYVRYPTELVDKVGGLQVPVRHNWDTLGKFFPGGDPIVPTSLLFLDHHEVVLPVSSDPFQRDLAPINNSLLPVLSNGPASLNWVVGMGELGNGSANVFKIDQSLLNDVKPGDDVAAFVRLRNGRVSSGAADFQFQAVKPSDPQKSLGTLNRSVAQMVRCDLNVTTDPIVIKCRHYGSSQETATSARNLAIRFKPGVVNPWIVAGLSSLEDLFQLSTVDKENGQPDYHFRLLYRLAETKVDDKDVILPFGNVPSNDRELGAPRCVPAKLS
jgi:hypothetical protein